MWAHTMVDQLALWAGTDEGGGITTYVRVMQQTPLWTEWNIRYVVTHRDGSAATKIWAFARGGLLLVLQLITSRPNLVHLHCASDTSFVRKAMLLWASWFCSIPVVMHIHGSDFHDYYEKSPRIVQSMIRSTLTRASAVVALGEGRAARLQEIAPAARITVIPNAVRPACSVAQQTDGKPVHVVFLGRIGERKGTFRLLEAWAELARDTNFAAAAILTIAGDGEVERASHRVRELGLQDSVQVRGWLSECEVGQLLDSAHVLALPSRNEGQPMAVLEAMARGLCVVASGVGGLPEMIGGGCGVIVAPDDVVAIASALRLVVGDQDLRARYGAAAYARAANQFDVGTVWRELDTLYREVAWKRVESING
jgi:glycosyltransferase involved in cell wall biosynthesis